MSGASDSNAAAIAEVAELYVPLTDLSLRLVLKCSSYQYDDIRTSIYGTQVIIYLKHLDCSTSASQVSPS